MGSVPVVYIKGKRAIHGTQSMASPRADERSFRTVMFLSASGGLQDALHLHWPRQVFANAQTGNIVLMSQAAFNGDLSRVLHYLIPLLSFCTGRSGGRGHPHPLPEAKHLHWRQLVLVVEILLLFGVGFPPNTLDLAANALVSFACAMQVQAFPQGTRLPVRQHHVHRQHAQRHGIVGGLLPPADKRCCTRHCTTLV